MHVSEWMDDLGAIFESVIKHAPALAAAGVAQITLPSGIHLALRPVPQSAPIPSGPTLLPLSRPSTQDGTGESLASRQRRFREAIEFAHVEGYPNPVDYGLTADQVGT